MYAQGFTGSWDPGKPYEKPKRPKNPCKIAQNRAKSRKIAQNRAKSLFVIFGNPTSLDPAHSGPLTGDNLDICANIHICIHFYKY